MFEWKWKVEEQDLTNHKHEEVDKRYCFSATKIVYDIENELSVKEKLLVLNNLRNGEFSYFIKLNEAYMEALKNGEIKTDCYGYAKENSKKAWIRRNDTRFVFWNGKSKDNMFTNDYLRAFGFRDHWYFGYEVTDTRINDAFHYLCCNLAEKEHEWFCEHDEYEILKQKFRDCGCPKFGAHICTCSDGNIYVSDGLEHDKWGEGERPITINELKHLLTQYDRLKAFEEKLSEEVNIQY